MEDLLDMEGSMPPTSCDKEFDSISPHSVESLYSCHQPKPLRTRESVLQRLSEKLVRHSLTKIDLSQRGLVPSDARLLKMALLQNHNLSVVKLGYNHIGDTGAQILAGALSNVESLDLGFNQIGDVGCAALCQAACPRTLRTLYLAGNLIGEEGALQIASLLRKSVSLRKLYLTGNLLGPDGVTAIAEACLESAVSELYLGGAGMGPCGCKAIAHLLQSPQCGLQVLSLPNCDLDDAVVAQLSASLKANHQQQCGVALESLNLSFNQITCQGIESLSNAVWGSQTLKELLLDNNQIEDRGAQLIAAVLFPQVKTLERLDVGFNLIKTTGIKMIMKAVMDSPNLKSLSVSGNTIDTGAARAISYALAYNQSLECLSLVHCDITSEGQRHITAGIVSNSKISLRELSGYSIGPVVVTLGFPSALSTWNNARVLHFVHTMWDHHQRNGSNRKTKDYEREEEKITDPLHFLDGSGTSRSAPLEATIVVELAKIAFAELGAAGSDSDAAFSNSRCSNEPAVGSPIVGDEILLESLSHPELHNHIRTTERRNNVPMSYSMCAADSPIANCKVASFVAQPEVVKRSLADPERKKNIAKWLSQHIDALNKLSEEPFHPGELWRLHQHYFTPVVNESGGESVVPSPNPSVGSVMLTASSVPEVSKGCPIGSRSVATTVASDSTAGESGTKESVNQMCSLPLLKRKVSYHSLGDAALLDNNFEHPRSPPQRPVSMVIEGGPGVHSMPPKTKRARRNRSRISFVPRVKAKLDSYLDVSHDKALSTMRQLYYVEQAIISGKVNPIIHVDSPRTHLSGDLAADAETIVVDMM